MGIGSAIQDKAKQSVARLTTFGAAVRNHLQENPFGYHRNTQEQPLSRSTPSSSTPSASLHPSLVRGQTPAASDAPQQRKPKPLPPIPVGPSSAFPPNITTNPPSSSTSPWDAFNDNTEPLKPGHTNRPKSATVTASSPSGTIPINSPQPTGIALPHSNSTNSLAMPSSPLPPNTNVFEFSPFDLDTTPATPAPSISNTARAPDWFSPELVSGKLAAVSSNDPLNPFFAPPSPKLPPVSMKPMNPFVENANQQAGHDAGQEENNNGNIFTSFSLDALAPPDIQNVHSPLATSYGSGGFFGGSSSYGSPSSSSSGAYIPKPGGTVPNYNNAPTLEVHGTSPNTLSASPDFDSFLAARIQPQSNEMMDHIKAHARASSSSDIPAGRHHHQQLLAARMPVRASSTSNIVPQQQQPPHPEDDFDSFLASRIQQM